MLTKLFVVFLVGYASASPHYAWKPNTEYSYVVLGRTLNGLPDHDPTLSGILTRSELKIVPKTPELLTAKIVHAQYCSVQTKFTDGWEEEKLPESKCQYKRLGLTEEPFEIHLQEGIIKDVAVPKTLKNWEANMIKAVISQLQLNVNAKYPIESELNVLPKGKHCYGVFKAMEQTVTGEVETTYVMKPEPEPVWPILRHETHDSSHETIGITKTKNFTTHGLFVEYHYGFGEMETSEPNTDSMGKFMNRSSISNAVIFGDLQDYVIKSSNTTNVVSFKPLYNNHVSGIVASKVSLILNDMQPGKSYVCLPDLISVGILYRYDDSYERNHVEDSLKPQLIDDEDTVYNRPGYRRLNDIRAKISSGFDQNRLELEQPLRTMPHDKINVVEEAKKIALQIGEDLQQPGELPKKATMPKFVHLVHLSRHMNKDEMYRLSEALYTKEEHGPKAESWKVLRDAVAQSGNGPALLTIHEWIKSGKIDGYEAAHVVARMSVAARPPTAKYLRAFQKLVEESVENHHHGLNNTALISYSFLLRKVCVSKTESFQQYPFHNYGSFYNPECQNIAKEYIRYLESRLHKSVAHSADADILVYSLALGYVGHSDIYRVFEKYLRQTPESRPKVPREQRVTEFQRFVMVNSMRGFVELYPETAKSFLRNIYFSISEQEELRSVAAYLMAHAQPDVSELTAMAQFTHIDKNENVNSAVKSMIHALIKRHYKPAIHAERYLNDEEYGLHHSHSALYRYVREHVNTELRSDFWMHAGIDHILPRGVHEKLQVILGDAHINLGIYDIVVSSVKDTLHIIEHQSESHHQQIQKKHPKGNPHSSHEIYESLGMHVAAREEWEGLAHIRLADVPYLLAFDNYSIHNIPEAVTRWQNKLKTSQKFSFTKWFIKHEAVMSAPTEMGLPYTFTTGFPSLWNFEGKVQAEAHPEVCRGNLLNFPDNVQANVEVCSLVNKESHSTIRFYTPFDHQDYVSGYSKKLQVHLPINAKIQVDLKNNDITFNFKLIQPTRDIPIFLHSTTPYNAKTDLFLPNPAEITHHYIPLIREEPTVQAVEFGKSLGLQLECRYTTDHQQLSWGNLISRIQHKGAIDAALGLLWDDDMLYSQTELWYKGTQCANREVNSHIRYGHKHYEHQQGSLPSVETILNLPQEQAARFEQLIEKAAAEIKNIDVLAGDIHVQFAGQREININAGVAYGRSPSDKHSRAIAYIRAEPKHTETQPWYLAFLHNGESPNTNGLDLDYALQMNDNIKSHSKLVLGHQKSQLSTVEIDAEFSKTKERIQYLKELPQYTRCKHEMLDGNHILPNCANMTAHANLMDDVQVDIKYDGLPKEAKHVLQVLSEMAHPCKINKFKLEDSSRREKNIKLHFKLYPDLHRVNYTVEGNLATYMKHSCERIPINRWQRQLVVLHPVFPLHVRLIAEAYNIDTYRPVCIVDKTRAATFDGKEYEARLSDSWTVMLHYLPQFSYIPPESDLEHRKNHQIREHVVLVREDNHGKAVKITLRTPETEQKLVEVELKPTGQSHPKVKVLVDKKEVQYNQHQCKDFHHRAVRVYGLPNEEVKVEIGNDYYVIADGHRAKLSTTSTLFLNSTRGLCGNFNGLKIDDFMLPNGETSIESSNHFVQAYTIGSPHQQKQHRVQHERVYYPIPSYEKYEDLSYRFGDDDSTSCGSLRTLYFRKNNQDCFSTRRYLVCDVGCKSSETSKTVDLICAAETPASQLWKRKAEAGGHLHFGNRPPNDFMETKVQYRCEH